jgi:hypothetical protein
MEGVKYTKDASGKKYYVQIDMDACKGNPLVENVLDILERERRKNTYPLDDVISKFAKKNGKKF